VSAPAGIAHRSSGIALGVWYVLVVLFLFAPIVTSLLYSFNAGSLGKQTSTFTDWTLDWFAAAWNNVSLRRSVETSVVASFWSALISVIVGTSLGFALVRHPSPLVRRFLSGLTYVLLIVPETVMGVSLLLFYAVTGLRLGMPTLVAGITPLAIAVTALIVRAGVLTLDRQLEDAAADLGAGRWKALWYVVLPHLAPAVLAGALMSYVFSFDNLVISTFLTTASINTLPVYLYGSLQYGPSPAVYAAATAVFVFTLLLVAISASFTAPCCGATSANRVRHDCSQPLSRRPAFPHQPLCAARRPAEGSAGDAQRRGLRPGRSDPGTRGHGEQPRPPRAWSPSISSPALTAAISAAGCAAPEQRCMRSRRMPAGPSAWPRFSPRSRRCRASISWPWCTLKHRAAYSTRCLRLPKPCGPGERCWWSMPSPRSAAMSSMSIP